HVAPGRDDLGTAVDRLDRSLESNVNDPLACVLERELSPLRESLRNPFDAEWNGSSEETGRSAGHRDVGDVADVAVENGRPVLPHGDDGRRAVPAHMLRDALVVGARGGHRSVNVRARSDGRAVAVRESPNHSESREVHRGRSYAGS